MKKISILLAAASVLVVGGVYAGWSYSQGAVAAANDDIAAVMTAETVGSSKGTLSVNTSATKFEIDDIVEDGVAYKPVLVLQNEPVVTFTPSVGADASVIANGITLEWNITIHDGHGDWKYDSTFTNSTPDKDIFTLSGRTYTIPEANKAKVGDAFTYTIPKADILDAVKLTLEAESVLLDTKAKYDSFKDDLMSGAHFVLHVQEKA